MPCIQRIKQILLYHVGAAPDVDEPSTARQARKPRCIEYAVGFDSQWQHVHQDVALPQEVFQLLQADVTAPTRNILQRTIPATELKSQWLKTIKRGSPEIANPHDTNTPL
ncbi:hypothetical protein D3C76_1497660 [compost metagenome]